MASDRESRERPSRRSNRRAGQTGEAEAAAFLEAEGYRLLARNYRCPFGEIDLVAEEGETLVFVEVKARSSVAYGLPRDALTPAKRRKLARSASHYLMTRTEGEERAFRIDVVEVALVNGRAAGARVVRGAFSLEEVLESLPD